MARIGSTEATGNSGATFSEQPTERDDAGSTVDPREIDAASTTASTTGGGSGETVRYNKDGSIRKKRGPNKNTASAQKAVPLDVSAIQFSLTGIHQLLAVALKAKEMELSDVEAQVLAQNVANVGRHYDLVASQKSIDWFNLCMAIATIHGTRVIAISARKAEERKAKRGMQVPAQQAPMQPAYSQTTTPRKPTEQERSALLDELPLSTSMHN